MTGTTKQALYTGALTELGDRKYLTSENVTAIRALDDVYDGVLEECLEYASWNHAIEETKFTSDTGIEPVFGFKEVFAKPTDFLRLEMISADEYFTYPLLSYTDTQNYWAADQSPIYVRYVSNDTGSGLLLTSWPRSFIRYVELELACRVCMRLTQSETLFQLLERRRDKARRNAANKDAINGPNPKFTAPGSWTRSRWGGAGGDRGSRNNLTG